MSLSVDLYTPADSWLYKLDPRVKLIGAFAGSLGGFLLRSPLMAMAYLLVVVGMLLWGKVPRSRIRWVLHTLLPVTLLILIIQPWFVLEGDALFTLGPLQLTSGGFAAALLIAIRANVLALLALLPLFTTTVDDLVRGMVQLGLSYRVGLMITLALRYIPVAAGLFTTIKQAQEARGLNVDEGHVFQRIKRYVPILTALVIQSVRLSDQLAMALAVRGLNHGVRTERRHLHMTGRDWLTSALIGAALALGISLRIMG